MGYRARQSVFLRKRESPNKPYTYTDAYSVLSWEKNGLLMYVDLYPVDDITDTTNIESMF
jgi:hypothetical protein